MAFGYRQMDQLFTMGFEGTSVSPQIPSLIKDYNLGSIILIAKNLKCADCRFRFWSDASQLSLSCFLFSAPLWPLGFVQFLS
jgi:hypothetical protein